MKQQWFQHGNSGGVQKPIQNLKGILKSQCACNANLPELKGRAFLTPLSDGRMPVLICFESMKPPSPSICISYMVIMSRATYLPAVTEKPTYFIELVITATNLATQPRWVSCNKGFLHCSFMNPKFISWGLSDRSRTWIKDVKNEIQINTDWWSEFITKICSSHRNVSTPISRIWHLAFSWRYKKETDRQTPY